MGSIFSLRYNEQGAITRTSMRQHEGALQRAVGRLSTGKKYNVSEDGPASYSILQKLDTRLGASEQGVLNAQNGISLLDTADAALSNIERIFTDISVLAEDAANGVWTDEQREIFNNQAIQLLTVADTIAESTNFIGSNVIDGTMPDLTLQVGITNQEYDIITIEMPSMRTAHLTQGMTTGNNGPAIELGNQQAALETIGNIKEILRNIRNERSSIGAQQNAIESAITNRVAMNEETRGTISAIGDIDVAEEMENYTNATAQVQASSYMFTIAMRNPEKLTQLMQSI